MADLVLIERTDALATVTINRPQQLNALNNDVIAALQAAFAELAEDSSIRVVILTGSGDRGFIAGADIAAMKDMTPDVAREFMLAGQALCAAIEDGPQVVIGALNGYALGGGCEVALACDIRLASERCRIGLPEVTLGILPAWGGTQRLPQIVGKGIAKQMILTGDAVDAAEALRIGLVNAVYAPDQLMGAAQTLAARILKNGPSAVRMAKHLINVGYSDGQTVGLAGEIESETSLFGSDQQREGMTAFVEKRAAQFK